MLGNIVETISIESEIALQQLLKQGTAFRGQSNAAWKLESRVERAARDKIGKSSGADFRSIEASLIDQFIERCIRLELGDIYSPNKLPHMSNTFEWLSLMQHYGHPTRLIDFTDDIWVALHFALSGDDPSVPFAIFAIEMVPGDEIGNKLPKDSNGKIYRAPSASGQPNTNELLGLTIKFHHFQSAYGTTELGEEWSTPKQNYGWDAPAIRNMRIKRQKGRFLYQVLPDGQLEQIPLLTKYTVQTRLRSTARLLLDRLGTKYSAEYLFPTFEKAPSAQQGAAPNSRPPSQLPTSSQLQSSDSRRAPSSGGCG